MMKAKNVSCFIVLTFLLFLSFNVQAEDKDARKILNDSKLKIDRLSSYKFKVKFKSDLEPKTSGNPIHTIGKADGYGCVKNDNGTLKGYEKHSSTEKYYIEGKWSKTEPTSEATTIRDGKEIYFSSSAETPVKWIDCDANNFSFYFTVLYKAICNKSGITYLGKQNFNHKPCYVIKVPSSELSIILLGIEAPFQIAIDTQTGFPLKLWVNAGKSTVTVEYKDYEVNPKIEDSLFVPSQNIKFDLVNGLERQFGKTFSECNF